MLLDREINEAKLIVQFFNLTGPEKYWKSSMKKGLSWKCCFWKMFDVSFVNKNGHFNNKSPSIFFFDRGAIQRGQDWGWSENGKILST